MGAWLALGGPGVPTLAAEVFTSSGLTFVGVRDAGNRGATAAEAPLWPTWAPPLGAVNHDFGIMRTNVTNAEWIEFVRAYGQHYPGNPGEFALTGPEIFYTGTVGGVRQYSIGQGAERHSAQASWRTMARFCNWLHNDKASQAWAFENGAYDASTFAQVVVGGTTMLTDQYTHHPDARYWIPTVNEYTKAAHWDPDKFGPGQGGYWLMPDGGDERLVAGPPGVGEAAGDWWQAAGWTIDTELYPDTQSPWGMRDVSSTWEQFTEGYIHPSTGVTRLDAGSTAGSTFYWLDDRLDNFDSTGLSSIRSLRIATAIPAPPTLGGLVVGVVLWNRRRRHDTESCQTRRGGINVPPCHRCAESSEHIGAMNWRFTPASGPWSINDIVCGVPAALGGCTVGTDVLRRLRTSVARARWAACRRGWKAPAPRTKGAVARVARRLNRGNNADAEAV